MTEWRCDAKLVYMRVTVNIDDDVLAGARALAERKGTSLGSALSELARQGLEHAPIAVVGDGTMFAVPADAEPFTSEDVYRALNE